jgi:hypothetical protein
MGGLESETLCACLTEPVADKTADNFYEEFNLVSTSFCEYHFKDMIKIFHLEGMDDWSILNSQSSGTKGKNRLKMCLSLVCFKPPSTSSSQSVQDQRVSTAHNKAKEMLCSCFPLEEDKHSIHVAMSNYPTISIFMALLNDQEIKKMKKRGHRSILDMKDSASLHCLLAVNYFQEGTILRCCGLQPLSRNLLLKASM